MTLAAVLCAVLGIGLLVRSAAAARRLRSLAEAGSPSAAGAPAEPLESRGDGSGEHRADAGGGEAGEDDLAFDLDLTAICLEAGLPVEQALGLAGQATDDRSGLARLGRSLAFGDDEAPEGRLAETARLIAFSRSTGAALAPLISGHAADIRRREHRRRQLAAARLGVVLVVPLGVCVLPAFILLGVVPVLLTLIGDILPALR